MANKQLTPKYSILFLMICLVCCLPGTTQLPFEKGIRVLSPKFFPGWQGQHVSYPFVTYDTAMGRFRMYYAGSSSTQVNESLWDQWVTGVVTSRNGLDWVGPDDYEQVLFARKFMQGDVVNPDEQAKIFDAVFAIDACIVKDGAVYKCWYTGWNGDIEHLGGGISMKKNFRIGYATSADGLRWTKSTGDAGAGAVLSTGNLEAKDGYGVEDPYVIKENDIYRMWYVAWDGNIRNIHYATSGDGINWIKKGPMLHAGGFREVETQNPVIFKRAGQYELWYQGRYESAKQTHIGRATSNDGISWKKLNDITLHPEAPERAGRYSPWTSVSPAQDGKMVLGNVILLPDNSCQVFYAKQFTVSRELTYATIFVPLSFIYTERINP